MCVFMSAIRIVLCSWSPSRLAALRAYRLACSTNFNGAVDCKQVLNCFSQLIAKNAFFAPFFVNGGAIGEAGMHQAPSGSHGGCAQCNRAAWVELLSLGPSRQQLRVVLGRSAAARILSPALRSSSFEGQTRAGRRVTAQSASDRLLGAPQHLHVGLAAVHVRSTHSASCVVSSGTVFSSECALRIRCCTAGTLFFVLRLAEHRRAKHAAATAALEKKKD